MRPPSALLSFALSAKSRPPFPALAMDPTVHRLFALPLLSTFHFARSFRYIRRARARAILSTRKLVEKFTELAPSSCYNRGRRSEEDLVERLPLIKTEEIAGTGEIRELIKRVEQTSPSVFVLS